VHQAREIFARQWDDRAEIVTLAYMLAWLRVAGDNSLVPAWVWHRYPAISSLLSRLRQTPCGSGTWGRSLFYAFFFFFNSPAFCVGELEGQVGINLQPVFYFPTSRQFF
jgi:hypothetical protein